MKTMKANETMGEDSPSQMHHIVDQVLRESDSDKDMDDIMKRVQTEDEKELKALAGIQTAEVSRK